MAKSNNVNFVLLDLDKINARVDGHLVRIPVAAWEEPMLAALRHISDSLELSDYQTDEILEHYNRLVVTNIVAKAIA